MNTYIVVIATVLIGIAIFAVGWHSGKGRTLGTIETMPQQFTYTFNVDGTLEESGSPEGGRSPYWWLDSGAKFIIHDGFGETIQGSLFALDKWRLQYAVANPSDTDHGFHPQNIFRLVSKNVWRDVRIESDFRITADNFSDSKNRNASNGVLLMSRYIDGDTLYYGGLRVDGTAVIKKKYEGAYYTMAQKKTIEGTYSTQSSSTSNLLPHGVWFHFRMDTKNNDDGSVSIALYGTNNIGTWVEILSAIDDGKTYDETPVINGDYRIGIRTDFMDVQFRNFHAERL